jgi:diguanylate cyclase (GGDEF)-like protein
MREMSRSCCAESRRPWTWAAQAALAAFVAAYVVVLVQLEGPSRVPVLDILNVVTPFAALAACLFAGLKAPSIRSRWFWLLLALGHGCALFGEAAWAHYEILGLEVPYPSIADVGWVLYYPFVFVAVGLLLSFQGLRRLSTAVQLLDAVLFAITAGALCWLLLAAPQFDPGDSLVAGFTNVSYSAGDVLILVGIVAIWLTPDRSSMPRGLGWLCGSLVVTFVADAAYTLLSASGAYETGSWLDPLWPVGYALAAFGAMTFLRDRPGLLERSRRRFSWNAATVQEWTSRARTAMPYLVFPGIAAMLAVRFVLQDGAGRTGDIATLAVAIVLTALLLVRQLLVVVANHRLQRSLRELSIDLERRVVARTEELAIEKEHLGMLHRVAVEMSQCLEATEVVRCGLSLALETTKASAAILQLYPIGSRTRSFGNVGLSRAARLQLLASLKCDLACQAYCERRPTRIRGSALHDYGVGSATGPSLARVDILPLIVRRSVLGMLCLAYDEDAPQGIVEDMALAEGVAAQLAATLENAWRYDGAEHLADHDPLTGLFNHRGVAKTLEKELARSQRTGSSFSVVAMDLDGFKLFNDTYGHAVGDDVLRRVAKVLRRALRRSDSVGRQGGDEFMAVLADASAERALECFERVRVSLGDNAIRVEDGSSIPLFMSFGIATYPFDGRRISELLAVADANLYRSKQRGGDCISASTTGEGADEGVRVGVFSVLDGLVNTVDQKDHYTRRHSEDVTDLALELADKVGLSAETARSLRIAALLHDVGKIGIPDYILRKPGKLSEEETEAIHHHVLLGELFIKEIPNLVDVVQAVGTHHERWDGTGYPHGLRGTDIPLLGRILAVSDAYSAMTTDRPYRKALSKEQAGDELQRVAGSQLDPQLVDSFLAVVEARERALERKRGASVA